MTCPTCGNPSDSPCAWGVCPDCHAAHLCQPIERKQRGDGMGATTTYAETTEVWPA